RAVEKAAVSGPTTLGRRTVGIRGHKHNPGAGKAESQRKDCLRLAFHKISTLVEIVRAWTFCLMMTATHTSKEREATGMWDKFLDRVKSRVSLNTFTTWFAPTRLNRADGDTIYVQIPTVVFRQVLTRTYGEIIRAVFHELGMPNLKVQYVCTEED